MTNKPQIWATKNDWSSEEDHKPKRHHIIQTIGPFSMSACGIIACEDSMYGWSDFKPYKTAAINEKTCGKCLSEKEL